MLKRIIVPVIILALLAGGFYYLYLSLLDLRDQEHAPVFATAPAHYGSIAVVVEGFGQLQPMFRNYIESPINGTVQSLHITDGQTVEVGDLIAQLSNEEIGYELQEEQFRLERLRNELASILAVPASEVMRVDPSRGVQIRAPISGRISDIRVDEESDLLEGSLIAKIVDDSRVVVAAELLHGEHSGVKPGQAVTLRFPTFDNALEGRVVDVGDTAIPRETHFVYRVVIEAPNPGLLSPGMEVNLTMHPPAGDVPVVRTQYIDSFGQETLVYSPAQGALMTLHVKDMAYVEKGDTIATLAGETTRRYVQEKQNEIRELELSIARKEEIREQLTVYSPLSGTVGWVHTRVGMRVRPGEPFAHVFDNTKMNVRIQVDEIDVIHLKQDQEAMITVEAMPGRMFLARVVRVDTMGHTEGGFAQYGVSLEVEETEELKPGMTANVHIFVDEKHDVLLIPMEAVFERDGKACVEILVDDRIQLVEVEVGLINDRVAQIISGLHEGQKVVTGSSVDRLDVPFGEEDETIILDPKVDIQPVPVPARPGG